MKVLLTGASRGVGSAVLAWLVTEGHDVVTISRSQPDPRLSREWIRADLARTEDLDGLRFKLQDTCFDILINNAGGGRAARLDALELDTVEREVRLNLTSTIYLTSLVFTRMVEQRFGRIINISSIAGRTGTENLFSYGAAKAGVITFTQAAALYLSGTGVTVNAICPGGIDTAESQRNRKELSVLRGLDPDKYQDQMASKTGAGLIDVGEIVPVIDLMIRTPALNGQSVNVCGLLQMN